MGYWALPISQHLPKDGTGISVFELVFMKIFRLELLGDFDIPNLEGTHPVINGNWTGDRLRAEIGDPKESPLFHDAIMIIVLFASGGVTVLLMNVAIGVVSTAYSTNTEPINCTATSRLVMYSSCSCAVLSLRSGAPKSWQSLQNVCSGAVAKVHASQMSALAISLALMGAGSWTRTTLTRTLRNCKAPSVKIGTS